MSFGTYKYRSIAVFITFFTLAYARAFCNFFNFFYYLVVFLCQKVIIL